MEVPLLFSLESMSIKNIIMATVRAVADLYVNVGRLIAHCGGILGSCILAHPLALEFGTTRIPLCRGLEYYIELFKKMTLSQLADATTALLPHATHIHGIQWLSLVPSIKAVLRRILAEGTTHCDDCRNHADLVRRAQELGQERDSLRETLNMVNILANPSNRGL
jgi:hypothetical protein